MMTAPVMRVKIPINIYLILPLMEKVDGSQGIKKKRLKQHRRTSSPKVKKNVFGQKMNLLPEFLWSFSMKKERL